MRDGQVVDRQVGAAPAPALRSWLDRSLPASPHDADKGADTAQAG
jgi:thioredoxin-like negative regulator of GroEL